MDATQSISRTLRDFIAALHHYFVHVSTDEQSETAADAMRLRHDVFCVEFGFEPQTTTRQERDRFDSESCHLVLYRSDTCEAVGCARLVHSQTMPTEPHITPGHEYHPSNYDRSNVAEVSRIVVHPEVRDGKPVLMLVMALMCVSHQMHYRKTYACMDPRLTRLIRMMQGMSLTAVSEPFEHKGMRQVSLLDYEVLYTQMMDVLSANGQLQRLHAFVRWREQRPQPVSAHNEAASA